ncbi:CLUMA_CG010182, isoform A [Clunio marinus]|uniref:CLUMA_CG010182, isoform A n=1 Tax=Clunio marinus TaxID=568069 RepID=A0A1J1I888_9DIPT|nr:CLUMA_CG010182, isoform A [Clunio marinus]
MKATYSSILKVINRQTSQVSSEAFKEIDKQTEKSQLLGIICSRKELNSITRKSTQKMKNKKQKNLAVAHGKMRLGVVSFVMEDFVSFDVIEKKNNYYSHRVSTEYRQIKFINKKSFLEDDVLVVTFYK